MDSGRNPERRNDVIEDQRRNEVNTGITRPQSGAPE